jgi:vancomycin resistance protein YoaR
MSTEFRPLEAAPSRRSWPYAVIGAALVIALVWSLRRNAVQASEKAPQPQVTQASANVAEPKIAPLVQEKPASPNLIGGAVSTAKTLAMVARSELDRALAGKEGAQKQAAAYKRQIDGLEKQLADARAEIAAIQKSRQPPPPTEQEQILQMLAPVLKTSSNP